MYLTHLDTTAILPPDLYQLLIDEQLEGRRLFEKRELGEGMFIINQLLNGYWKPRFLIDETNHLAYEFMTAGYTLCTITTDDIAWDEMTKLDEDSISRARDLDMFYPSHIYKYENGIARVEWQLHPDGRYYMDDDGYGMTNDVEVNIYGYIDRTGKVVVKFSPNKQAVYERLSKTH